MPKYHPTYHVSIHVCGREEVSTNLELIQFLNEFYLASGERSHLLSRYLDLVDRRDVDIHQHLTYDGWMSFDLSMSVTFF